MLEHFVLSKMHVNVNVNAEIAFKRNEVLRLVKLKSQNQEKKTYKFFGNDGEFTRIDTLLHKLFRRISLFKFTTL